VFSVFSVFFVFSVLNSVDTNGAVAALLHDLASVQKVIQSRRGYKRAADTIFGLEEQIDTFLQRDGTLQKIPNIGPKSARVVMEYLASGGSPTVDAAIHESGAASSVEEKRKLRSNFLSRAQVIAALHNDSLTGPALADYRGDFQMHSVWSDGGETLAAMAAAAFQRGYRYCGISDHSHGLRIAGGLTMLDLERQHQEVDVVNRDLGGRFRMLKGVEANIMADGSIDLSTNELARMEVVVAAPHSALRSANDQTARMVAAVRAPGVHILGHPRGRMYGSRAGVVADWDEVFGAAVRANVAIEIDGDPARQDIDHALAHRAIKAGCLFSLNSDAHTGSQLRYAETAIAHARLAGIPAERVINCWELDRLLDWLADRPAH
jgi:histidinol phosphatase-like PHP family hydrolase